MKRPLYNTWHIQKGLGYMAADHAFLCGECACGGNGSLAASPDLDPKCPDHDQWRIIGSQMFQLSQPCIHCGKEI